MERDYFIDNVVTGDSFELIIEYKDSDGNAINVTDHEIEIQIRESVASNSVDLDATYSVAAADGPNGIVRFSLTAAQTSALNSTNAPSASFVYYLRLSNTGDTVVNTLLTGRMRLIKGIV